MYIKSFRIKNYMIHKDTQLNLSPLTVFVGPNGGGKSALFDSLINFSLLARGSLQQAFGPYPFSFKSTLYRGAANNVARIGYTAILAKSESDENPLRYEINYSQANTGIDDPQSYTIFSEKLTEVKSGKVLFDRENIDDFPLAKGLKMDQDKSIFAAVRQYEIAHEAAFSDAFISYLSQQISRFNKFRLDPTTLSQPSRLYDVAASSGTTFTPCLGYHGEDLASSLYYLNERNAPEIANMVEYIRRIEPNFDKFEFNSVGPDRIAFMVSYSDRRQSVPAVRLSSGFLLFLGLMVLVCAPNRPPVIMIEEPENGLTPQAVKVFYDAVRALAIGKTEGEKSQVLMASHSPFVICEAWNGEDRNFIHQVKVQDGAACVRSFDEVIKAHSIMLSKDESGKRTHLSLKNAEEIMSGYL